MIFQLVLLLVSLILYSGYGIPGLVFLFAAALITYVVGLLLPKFKWLLIPCLVVCGGMLLILRLEPVTGFSILAPMGFSYFSLQIISYLVDVRNGKYEPETDILKFVLFVVYYPHLLQGPIESWETMKKALDEQCFTWDNISRGAIRALWGLFKRLAIASRAGVIVSTISGSPDEYRGAYALFAMLLYSIQLYADFSGGMDIILGISQMLGLKLSENFDTPYFSQPFQEFWRRWHITLGAWLRKYIYIPLGGNRKGKARKFLNLTITIFLSVMLHVSYYLIWGLVHGILVATGDHLKTRFKAVNCVITYLLVSILWSFFIWPTAGQALMSIGSLFTTFNYGTFFASLGTLGLESAGEWIVLICSIGILWVYDLFHERISAFGARLIPAARVAVMGVLTMGCLVFGMYGLNFVASDFIYSKF